MGIIGKKIVLILLSICIIVIIYKKVKIIELNEINKKNLIDQNLESKYLNELNNLSYEDRVLFRNFIGTEYSKYKRRNLTSKITGTFKNTILFSLLYETITENSFINIIINSLTISLLRSTIVAVNIF